MVGGALLLRSRGLGSFEIGWGGFVECRSFGWDEGLGYEKTLILWLYFMTLSYGFVICALDVSLVSWLGLNEGLRASHDISISWDQGVSPVLTDSVYSIVVICLFLVFSWRRLHEIETNYPVISVVSYDRTW